MTLSIENFSIHSSLFTPVATPYGKSGSTARQIFIEEKNGVTEVSQGRDIDRAAPLLKVLDVFVKILEKIRENPFDDKIGFDQRVNFFHHLVGIEHLIEKHNQHIQSNFWITLLHVILCILTLGIFRFKESIKLPALAPNLLEVVGKKTFSEDELRILQGKIGSDLTKYGLIIPPRRFIHAEVSQYDGNGRFRCTRTCCEFLRDRIKAGPEALTDFLISNAEHEVTELEDAEDVLGEDAFSSTLIRQESPQKGTIKESFPNTIVTIPVNQGDNEMGAWTVQDATQYLAEKRLCALVTGASLTLAIRFRDSYIELFDSHGYPSALGNKNAYVAVFREVSDLSDFLLERFKDDINDQISFYPLKLGEGS